MQEPGFPANETYRLSTLQGLNLLDTPAEERFDRLARIAKRLFNVPIVLIVLIDSDRQWFKSAIGVDINETPRSVSFCGHTILEDQISIVNDAHLDHRFADNPMVTDAPHIRFYAGRSINAANGEPIGTLCIADDKPRQFSQTDISLMNDMVELVEKETNFPDLKILNNRLMRSEQDLLDSLLQLRNNERHERSRNKSLELISRGYPLHEVLNSIVSEIENCNPHTIARIDLDIVNNESEQQHQTQHDDPARKREMKNYWSEPIKSANGELLGHLTVVAIQLENSSNTKPQFLEESAILASIAMERDQADQMIWKQANYDSLTGLPNRNLLRERLGQELNKARRHRLQLALLFIDLDHFKQINDTLGHNKGDELLAQIGSRLNRCMRDSDTVARLGGDEFTVIAVELNNEEDVKRVASKIIEELSREFKLGSESAYLSASVGIAFYPDHGDDMDELIRSADRAMYEAKNSGRNRFIIYSD
jgi:diguanylate cyclase (GGDEF)-like protein